MNIVVCVKQVMDTEALIELGDDGNVLTEGRTQIIDPYGEFAVEKAVQLKEQLGGEVTVLCYGDDGCTSAIRHALAMGAGIGSASMMAAATSSIIVVHPEWEETVRAYAAAANLLTSVIGIYFALFISLPVTIKVYEFFTGDKGSAKPKVND